MYPLTLISPPQKKKILRQLPLSRERFQARCDPEEAEAPPDHLPRLQRLHRRRRPPGPDQARPGGRQDALESGDNKWIYPNFFSVLKLPRDEYIKK